MSEIAITKLDAEQLDLRLRQNAKATVNFLADARRMKHTRGYKHLGFKTWSKYAADSIGYTPQHLNHLLEVQLVVERVAPKSEDASSLLSPNVRQARELSKAPAEEQAEVWSEVVEEHGEEVTAAKVAEAVERRKPEPAPPKPKNGSPTIKSADRDKSLKLFGSLNRSLDDLRIGNRCRHHMTAILTEIENA